MATRRNGICTSRGNTASDPYTKDKGDAQVGPQTVVRYGHSASRSLSLHSFLFLNTIFFVDFADSLIESFCEAIGSRVVHCGSVIPQLELFTKCVITSVSELWSVIMNEFSRHFEVIYDILLKKVHEVGHFYLY